MEKEKFFLIGALAIFCILSGIYSLKIINEKPALEHYKKAIEFYQQGDFDSSYNEFSEVSRLSRLRQVALFRQARCAINIGDNKTAIKNYNTLSKFYPNSVLTPISEYNLGILYYEKGEFDKSRKFFNKVINKYPNSEVSIASKYYLGLANKEKKLLLEYLKLSPSGRYAQNAIDVLSNGEYKLVNSDNLIIANSYSAMGKNKESIPYYEKTDLKHSWADYAKAEYKLKNYDAAKKITINGFSKYSPATANEKIYDVIDSYVLLSNNKQQSILYFRSLNPSSQVTDYLLYLQAKNSTKAQSNKIYEELYTRFPLGQFSAEALFKIFYSKIEKKDYDSAIRLGRSHLTKFQNTNSSPAVMFWLGKIYEKRHKPDLAKIQYRGVISKYPDTYYAFRANGRLNKSKPLFAQSNLTNKSIQIPIKEKKEAEFALKLAKAEDFDFIEELHPDDEFVKSWVEYQKGNYTTSALVARKAMEKLEKKPDFRDARWRLVYPVHYYDFIKKYSNGENKIILLSIIKEESHFNPEAKSYVAAGGLMQLMPATANEIAREYNISNNLFNSENNIHLGCLYYAKIRNHLGGQDASAVMAYNGGFSSVLQWKSKLEYEDFDDFVEKIPYSETQTYLKKVLRSYWNYSNIYK